MSPAIIYRVKPVYRSKAQSYGEGMSNGENRPGTQPAENAEGKNEDLPDGSGNSTSSEEKEEDTASGGPA